MGVASVLGTWLFGVSRRARPGSDIVTKVEIELLMLHPEADQNLLEGTTLTWGVNLIRVAALIAFLGALVAATLVLYRGYERLARRALERAYADLDLYPAKVFGSVQVVYHTYHGFLLWYTETEHRAILAPDEAIELLGRLLRFNLSWGLVARGGILIAPLAVYNYAVQKPRSRNR